MPDLGDAVGLGDLGRGMVADDHGEEGLVEQELLAELFGPLAHVGVVDVLEGHAGGAGGLDVETPAVL